MTQECSQRSLSLTTILRTFRWIVSVQRQKSLWFGYKRFSHSCGGALITPSWILTASHCLYGRDETIRVVAGTDNLSYLYKAQLRSVTKQIMHPSFDIDTYNNDVALLKVNEPFKINSRFSQVGTVCLERGVPVLAYDIATVSGFGAKKFHSKVRNHLYETDIAIIDQATCNKSFDGVITKNMICAGGMIANKRDACSGDSGGPLQMDVNQHVSLIGLVSFGNNCAMKGFPGIYTRLEIYIDWIVDNIDEDLPRP